LPALAAATIPAMAATAACHMPPHSHFGWHQWAALAYSNIDLD